MTHRDPLVILLDADNTLIDSDAIKADLVTLIASRYGPALRERFAAIYEDVRAELNVVSYPVVFQRLQREAHAAEDVFATLTDYMMRYPYRRRVFAGVRPALRALAAYGRLVVVTDGDPWFQGKKITDAGIAGLVHGNVLIFTHKEDHITDICLRYPADHYAFFDDKPHLLAAFKRQLGDRVTTVWVRQGAYAAGGWGAHHPAPDHALDSVAAARDLVPSFGARPGGQALVAVTGR